MIYIDMWETIQSCVLKIFGNVLEDFLRLFLLSLFAVVLLIKSPLPFLFLSAQPSAKHWHLS